MVDEMKLMSVRLTAPTATVCVVIHMPVVVSNPVDGERLGPTVSVPAGNIRGTTVLAVVTGRSASVSCTRRGKGVAEVTTL